MTSKYKRRGDEAEREGVAVLRELAADLLVPGAGREFGAGRALDVGDLKVFPDVAVQVRRNSKIRDAIRSAAADAVTQAGNRQVPLALGMVPITGASRTSVRWVAACLTWPVPIDPADVPIVGNHTAAVAMIRCEDPAARPRHQRITLVRRRECPDVFVASLQAWLHAYRATRADAHTVKPA